MSSAKQEIIAYISGSTGCFVNIVPDDKDNKFPYFAAGLSNNAYTSPSGANEEPDAPGKGNFNVLVSCDTKCDGGAAFKAAMSSFTNGIKQVTSSSKDTDHTVTTYYKALPLGANNATLSQTIDDIVNKLFDGNVGNGNVNVNYSLKDVKNVAGDNGQGFDWSKLTPKQWKYSDLSNKESFTFASDSTSSSGGYMRSFLGIMLLMLISVFIILGLFYLVNN